MDRSPPYSTIRLHSDDNGPFHPSIGSAPNDSYYSSESEDEYAPPPLPSSSQRPCRTKPCLKTRTPNNTPSESSSRENCPTFPFLHMHPRHPSYSQLSHPHDDSERLKTVVFNDTCPKDVFRIPNYDRSATEPARTPLSYQDLLELKAIQRQLPLADQPDDVITGRPASTYLRKVPIGLLPLVDTSSAPAVSQEVNTPRTLSSSTERMMCAKTDRAGGSLASSSPSSPPHSSALFQPVFPPPPRPSQQTPNTPVRLPRFNLAPLPLMDSPSPSAPIPESCSAPKSPKPRNVMWINGEEVSLDDEEPCAQESTPPSPRCPSPPPKKERNVMWINGVEIDLDEDEEQENKESAPSHLPTPPMAPSTLAAEPAPIDPLFIASSFQARRKQVAPPVQSAPTRSLFPFAPRPELAQPGKVTGKESSGRRPTHGLPTPPLTPSNSVCPSENEEEDD
ncbi:hypothetical protein CYLTODRAFT_166413 [Cylindrobasidium torrendii FP15055 ss-10]|uniref:Uncharacterized protein n=1 Tax=Cylindrobasidium torrendii FP15055 ss-10 TaxID=1314674 RepID=A0A0D7AZQ7_9AGAR|nr:hypothetical protein CYLTODRAFT_166413 [Cylindrobasidium torrendii FP15055 ss-10]